MELNLSTVRRSILQKIEQLQCRKITQMGILIVEIITPIVDRFTIKNGKFLSIDAFAKLCPDIIMNTVLDKGPGMN